MSILYYKKGYSLVEVLVATSVLLIATVGPLTIAAKGIQTSQFVREEATAGFLAQEGIEAVVAARNDGIIEALNNGDLSQSWNWQTNAYTPGIRDCFTSDGCNLDFKNGDTTSTIVSCNPFSNCAIHYNSGDDVPYGISAGGVETPYTRVIRLEEIGGNSRDKEVRVTSTVYWDSSLYSGGTLEQVEFRSTVFSLYD